jgi:hypothetical protein
MFLLLPHSHSTLGSWYVPWRQRAESAPT